MTALLAEGFIVKTQAFREVCCQLCSQPFRWHAAERDCVGKIQRCAFEILEMMWRSGGQMAERILQRFQESRRRRRSPSNINECNLPSFLNTSHSLLTVWKNLSAKSGPTGNNHHICDMFNNLLRTALENKNDTSICPCIISTSCTPLKIR